MNRTAKAEWRDDVVSTLEKSTSIFLANYSGMTVEELSAFRRELKSVKADFKVVKNTVARKALEGRQENVVSNLFKGQTAIVFSYGDVGATAKAVSEAVKKYEKLTLIAGCLDGAMLDKAAVGSIADLPSREVLLGKILSALVAPHRRILGALNGVSRNVVNVVSAIKDKKS